MLTWGVQQGKGAADVLGHLQVAPAERSRLSWAEVLQTDHAVLEGRCKGRTACPHGTAGAALGYVAHLTHYLATYLNVPLRFPLRLNNSHSWVLKHPPASSSIRWADCRWPAKPLAVHSLKEHQMGCLLSLTARCGTTPLVRGIGWAVSANICI